MTRSTTFAMNVPAATFAASVARAVASLVRALKHRREVMHLAEFDDRMLKDIGLTRADVEGALAEPLVRNPSSVLVRCAARRAWSERMVKSERNVHLVAPTVNSVRLCA
ncbi:DUF1127 domain-containing protein [Microvirga terricola]|uniref:DUF1127 domain-containing protein n=1 Tax=Microvirga terricola TaxID=2719797 RepID=A0ABX0VA06_9HYPH|nr:DUF1127 domain-containing protein [Microvirga terricola]NIX76682.1 DUF1127 domain-containing protein [Microvirga terricola]